MVEVLTIRVVTIEVVTTRGLIKGPIRGLIKGLIRGLIRGLTGHGRGDDLQRLEHNASTLQVVSL